MKKNTVFLRIVNLISGFLAIGAFVYIFYVLIKLQPKLVAYQELTKLESGLMTGVGFGLLVVLAFLLFSLWQIGRYIKHIEKLTLFSLFLIIGSVVCVLLVFSDIALLSDIVKQSRQGWTQPEWSMVYPFVVGQFVMVLLLVYLHLSGFFVRSQVDQVAMDVNLFLVVQYVGVICGLMGFGMASLGFIYSSGWSLVTHTIITSLVLVFPYGLAVFYWVITKIKEKNRKWWDEKQAQDIGKAALVTLAGDTLIMVLLFILNIRQLDGVVRMQWLPIYLFATVFLFSLGNLFFSSKA